MTNTVINKKNDPTSDFLFALVFSAIMIILISPAKYSNVTLNGTLLFATKILPVLLPFFFLTRILMQLPTTQKICKLFNPLCNKFFNISGMGAFIFFMGLLCGYPMGAKLTADSFEQGVIDESEAKRITTLVSTSGPMFIVGTVGAGFMFSAKVGAIVFFSHMLGAVFNGMLFSKIGKTKVQQTKTLPLKKTNSNLLASSAQDALQSVLMVGVYIILFFLFIEIFLSTFHITNPIATSLLSGIIEITRGTLEISKNISSTYLATVLLTFIISLGGISVHAQSLIFLNKCNISYKFFILQKLSHSVFSVLLACVLALLL